MLSTSLEALGLAALVAGAYELAGLGVALLVAGVVLLLAGLAADGVHPLGELRAAVARRRAREKA